MKNSKSNLTDHIETKNKVNWEIGHLKVARWKHRHRKERDRDHCLQNKCYS